MSRSGSRSTGGTPHGDEGLAMATLILGAASAVVDGIHRGLGARGFDDVRPAHGFVFVRLAPSGATVQEIADHLGVTKQATSQLVDELVRKGYVERHPHPTDRRARLVVLTERGWACARAAEESAAATLADWAAALGPARERALRADLARLAPPGRLRAAW